VQKGRIAVSLTGAQAIVKCLELEGVEFVFGMCGHTNLAMLDALADSSIRFISVDHEQIAVHAADCYYRVSHKPAVVLTTIAPGFTNAVTGMADAAQDGSAVVMISGNVPSSYIGREAFQELGLHSDASQVDVMRPIVKRAWQPTAPEALIPDLARAFNFALSGAPGPVLVDVPMDLFSYIGEFPVRPLSPNRPTSPGTAGDQSDVRRAVSLLAEALKPVIYAGGGVLASEASPELQALAEHLGIPVTTSMIAQAAMRNDHPLYGGFTGTVGRPTSNHLINNADVVLAIGTRFGEIDASSWLPEYFINSDARIIQVDIDPHQIGKTYAVEVGIVGDAKAVLGQMLSIAKETAPNPDQANSAWLEQLAGMQTDWREKQQIAQSSDAVPIDIPRVIKEIRAVLPDDGILLTGVGPRHQVGQHFVATRPQTHIVASGHGTMGLSVPGALGAKLARPESLVVSLTGDGEFRSVSQTLGTAVDNGVPVVWVVLNNYSYNIIALYQNRHYGRAYGTEFRTPDGTQHNPDFVALARAYGADGARVENPADLKPALEKALASGRPYVLDVIVTQTPSIGATGHWDANRFIKLGWNLPGQEVST
jgi:acetolactate synthase I/II/III large subunit